MLASAQVQTAAAFAKLLHPRRLHDAVAAFDSSVVARGAFGDEVVDHYAHAGRVEMSAFDAAVTDWERRRGFERL